MSTIFVALVLLTIGCAFVYAAESPPSKPIELDELEQYIKEMDSTNGWKAVFERLPPAQTQLKNWTYALIPENLAKHRYPPPEDNLLTYDDTRVVLPRMKGDNYSDFINANWINSVTERKRYIGTQCPMPSTIPDFYRMVWHQNIHQVVMLANPHDIEKNKCAKYFPDTNETYDGIDIILQRKIEYQDVVVRIYALKKSSVVRLFIHNHFVSWPDMGVPKDPKQLLSLIRQYRSSEAYTRSWPLLVHCSAGVGRTGTFLLTDAMYDRALTQNTLDFLKHLALIRTQRVSLVEKQEQYALAHRVILQAYKEGLFERSRPQPQFIPNQPGVPRVLMVDPTMAAQEVLIRFSPLDSSQTCPTHPA